MFHRLWEQARVPGSRWWSRTIHWSECPEFDQAWYETTRADYSDADWEAEFEHQFGSIADTVFRPQYVSQAVALGTQEFDVEGAVYHVGADVSGKGRDESVIITLAAGKGEIKARVVDAKSFGVLPATILQAEIERVATERKAVPYVDMTGLGFGIVGNLNVQAVGVTFTSGQEVTGRPEEPNIPRERLINNLVLGLERGQLAIPAEFRNLVVGLQSYRWDKSKARRADWVDALALAWWSVTGVAEPQMFTL